MCCDPSYVTRSPYFKLFEIEELKLACCDPIYVTRSPYLKLLERDVLKLACCEPIYVTRSPYLKLLERDVLKLACCAVTPVMSQDHPIQNCLKERRTTAVTDFNLI